MVQIPENRCERHRLFQSIDDAFRAGDFQGLSAALGNPARWVDERMSFELGLGHPLEYAIYWSPISFIEQLIKAGSNPNYPDDAGFPALIATLSTDRGDRLDILKLLLDSGAEPDRRGVNDWTPLHYAVANRDADAVRMLLASGADPELKTRIDGCESALEDAEASGFHSGASLMREAIAAQGDKS